MPVASTAGGVQPTSAPGQQKHVNPADVHVLLVDDEKLSRTVIGNLLKKCQYKGQLAYWFGSTDRCLKASSSGHCKLTRGFLRIVTVVESGVEALEMMKQKGPGAFNLVLTVSLWAGHVLAPFSSLCSPPKATSMRFPIGFQSEVAK